MNRPSLLGSVQSALGAVVEAVCDPVRRANGVNIAGFMRVPGDFNTVIAYLQAPGRQDEWVAVIGRVVELLTRDQYSVTPATAASFPDQFGPEFDRGQVAIAVDIRHRVEVRHQGARAISFLVLKSGMVYTANEPSDGKHWVNMWPPD